MRIPVKVAAVTGDDVLAALDLDEPTMEGGHPLSKYAPIISANAYLGAEALLPALASGADIVVTGRVADPSLFVAPFMHEYGWAPDDVDRLARGTAVGTSWSAQGSCAEVTSPILVARISPTWRARLPVRGRRRRRQRDSRQSCRHRGTNHSRHGDRATSLRSD